MQKAAIVLALCFTSACWEIHTYSDSILNDNDPYVVGDPLELRRSLRNEDDLILREWWAIGGTTITGETNHPLIAAIAQHGPQAFRSREHGTVPDVVIFSFGTNDVPNTYFTPTQMYLRTQYLIDQSNFLTNSAVVAGANCVIWVLPNPETFTGVDQFDVNARTILNAFKDVRQDLAGTYDFNGFHWEVKNIDWGGHLKTKPSHSSDTIHPNAAGFAWLAGRIKAKVRSCPPPD